MAPRLRILCNVLQRLKHIDNNVTGYLYGVMHDNTITILTFSININSENDTELGINHEVLQLSMPAEVYLCGILHVGEQEGKLSDAFQDIDVTDNPILLNYFHNEENIKTYFYIHQKLEAVNDVEIIDESTIYNEFVYIRLQGSLPVIAQNDNIVEVLEESRKDVASGRIGIHLPDINMYLFNADDYTKDVTIKELLQLSGKHEGSTNTKSMPGIMDVVPANMLLKMSGDKLLDEHIKYAPVLQHVRRSFSSLEGSLNIDALSLVHLDTHSSILHGILLESICRNIKLIQQHFKDSSEIASESIKLPVLVHFKPESCGHILTLAYNNDSSDNAIISYRKTLHKILGLGLDRPYFCYGNAIKFSTDVKKEDLLINPHQSISHTEDIRKNSSKIGIVQGLYTYHHYMQDNFDDNGWGCAYRSLQTIISWYRLQGYTNIPVPSHRTIQKCLVDIQDKPSNFIGSKQWIGSTEVGFVLEYLLGINVKVLCASTGEEVASFATNLIHHFETNGTPVMIGGGVLAHTILGTSYNESSGDVKFLILDPHYTGAEHLPTIISKGWCAWKSKDFWKKDAFYNMCLPQRPVCI